jgi:hypothetical protein
MKRPKIVAIFVVEYQENGQLTPWHESLTATLAYSLGRELAKRGKRPVVRRIDLHITEVRYRAKRRVS